MENTFISIGDIKGECMERNHKEWIPAKTLSWEVTRTLDMDDLGTTQRGYANSSFGKVSVTTELSVASPKLMLSVADGTTRKEITIEMCRSSDSAGKGMEPYLIWKLFDVTIDKYEVSGGEEQIPEEGWDMAYRRIEVQYKKADPATGALSPGGDFSWDLMAGEMG
ncbi:Hcp1 family type VI secretion system effector [Pseudooceanicola lipolyticus]|uniref:Hcp1 family type VI secretion system effector n=1 Tax=Pseudooceanicola lipolyticus TaxID=2029104 RepID=A0A2M8IXP8_9RHOB|nr:type VI secretion system tube protein Hcp [Pseudooceanicola lipolyticus]PJE35264.1 Hcp1 family type VI secretion system effector [Pseudooceanicola lipolyticus]